MSCTLKTLEAWDPPIRSTLCTVSDYPRRMAPAWKPHLLIC